MDKKGNELVMAFNFSPVTRYGFEIKPLTHARYIEAFSTDDEAFGGSGIRNQGALDAVLYDTDDGGEENAAPVKRSLTIDLPGLSAVILKPVGRAVRKTL